MLIEKIASLLEEKYKEEAYKDCFTVDITLSAAKKLEIFVDSDSGISFRTCQRISRYLEAIIDEENWLGEKYIIEVSSPGIGRPLKFVRQYQKNIGRNLKIKMNEGDDRSGILISANDEGIVLEEKFRIKEGKKKKTVIEQNELLYSDIKETKVKISFKA